MRPFAKGGFVPANQNHSPYINEGESILSNRMKEETQVTEDAEFEVIETTPKDELAYLRFGNEIENDLIDSWNRYLEVKKSEHPTLSEAEIMGLTQF